MLLTSDISDSVHYLPIKKTFSFLFSFLQLTEIQFSESKCSKWEEVTEQKSIFLLQDETITFNVIVDHLLFLHLNLRKKMLAETSSGEHHSSHLNMS